MAPCGALCVPPCISDMDTLMETRECRAGPLTAAIQPLSGEPSPQTHHTNGKRLLGSPDCKQSAPPIDTRNTREVTRIKGWGIQEEDDGLGLR
uniref:SFRICE_009609 n=1 Tax=Spodoptera frugiperda TaxID=7108 RepID=A0A2H1VD21_SPOFR